MKLFISLVLMTGCLMLAGLWFFEDPPVANKCMRWVEQPVRKWCLNGFLPERCFVIELTCRQEKP